MRKQTNTLSPSPKCFQSPKFSDSDLDVRKALLLVCPVWHHLVYEALLTTYDESAVHCIVMVPRHNIIVAENNGASEREMSMIFMYVWQEKPQMLVFLQLLLPV
jgi:hypothetical protein